MRKYRGTKQHVGKNSGRKRAKGAGEKWAGRKRAVGGALFWVGPRATPGREGENGGERENVGV